MGGRNPNIEQQTQIALAALDAVRAKSEELGVNAIAGSVLGIGRAYMSLVATMKVAEALGHEGFIALGRRLEKADAYDVLKQAEEALYGE